MATNEAIVLTGQDASKAVLEPEQVQNSDRNAELSGSIVPEGYTLIDAYLVTPPSNKVSIKPILLEITYYEDIFRGAITGEVLVNDSSSLIENYHMSGNEYFVLSFKKTKKSGIEEIKRRFRVYRVGERKLNHNQNESYTLHFCSEELLLSEQIKISKAFNGSSISDIVKNILTEELKIQKDQVVVDSTKGIYDFIVPQMKPFEAINWLASYAMGDQKDGADYVFFENKNGFNFSSLKSLYKMPSYGEYRFNVKGLGTRDNGPGKSTELGRSLVGIKSYKILDTFDTLYGTSKGAFANSLLTVDPMTRQYEKTSFNYSKYSASNKGMNGFPLVGELKNRLGKTISDNEDAVYKVAVTTKDRKSALYIKDRPQGVNKDFYVETVIPNRTAQMALAHYTRIKLSVPGDPNLSVGTVIKVTLPSFKQTKIGPEQYRTGNYLITSARHIIDIHMKYETILEIATESLSNQLPSYADGTEIQKSVKGLS